MQNNAKWGKLKLHKDAEESQVSPARAQPFCQPTRTPIVFMGPMLLTASLPGPGCHPAVETGGSQLLLSLSVKTPLMFCS